MDLCQHEGAETEPTTVRVVLVDDLPVMRRMWRRMIGSETTYKVVGEAADGEEALRSCLALRPDVLVTDLAMPKLDGEELIHRLRHELPEMVIVLCSSVSERALTDTATSLGVAHLRKEDADQLPVLIANLLAARRRTGQ